jgi:hypothetical protein
MIKSILSLAASLVAISSIASAEDLSTTTAPLPPRSPRQRILTNGKFEMR